MNRFIKLLIRSSILLLFIGAFGMLHAQRIDTEFGKNRVQYHDDFKYWWNYESENFLLHWYGKGKEVAQTALLLAEYDHAEIVNILEYTLSNKIEIIVFLDVSDLKQSNLGADEELFTNPGESYIIGNKLFVYYDGDHREMRKQIRRGIAQVYFNSILFGSSLQEIVQNAISSDLPSWFQEGLIEYIAEPWNFEHEAQLREIFHLYPKMKDFKKFSYRYPRVAGHSFWYFISNNYDNADITNIIYLTRIKRRVNDGFDFVLNKEMETLYEEWLSFFEERLSAFESSSEESEIRLKNADGDLITRVTYGPSGSFAYSTNSLGKLKVFYAENEKSKPRKIWKSGHKLPMIEWDDNYPLIDFNPAGSELLIIYEHRDVIKFRAENFKTGRIREGTFPENIQRVFSADFYHNSRFLLTAQIDGYADVVTFFPDTRTTERFTADYFEDRDASMAELNGERGVLFSSNRTGYMRYGEKFKEELPLNHRDIYFLSLNKKKLYQLTNTPLVNETQPTIQNGTLYYLCDLNGIQELKGIDLAEVSFSIDPQHQKKSCVSYDLPESSLNTQADFSDYPNSIYQYAISDDKERIDLVHGLENSGLYFQTIARTNSSIRTSYRTHYNQWAYSEFEDNQKYLNLPSTNINDTLESEEDKVYFKTRFGDFPGTKLRKKPDLKNVDEGQIIQKEIERPIHKFNGVRAVAYRLKFGLQDMSSSANNELLFGGLNTFAGTNEEFEPPPLGFLMKATAKDVFEDHIIEGGARLQFDLDGAEYYLKYSDRTKRIDKTYAAYTRGQTYADFTSSGLPLRIKERNIILLSQWNYPFDFFSSLRAIGTLRFDKSSLLSTDAQTLNAPDSVAERIGLRIEYVFDNSFVPDINQMRGARAKAYVEVVNRFEIGIGSESDFSLSRGVMTILGLDARYYKGLLRHSTFAVRFAGATSVGNEKILFHLGGVENWIFNSFNNELAPPPGENFVYRTIVTNMRGFQYNARNGNTFGVLNAELRVPLFKHIFSDRLRSSFLRSFQLVGFFDAGSAWNGLNPFDDANPLNSVMVNTGDLVTVNARFARDPFIYGYGFGGRALLLGYLLKVDYGWGIENGRSNSPRLYISLGSDF